MTPPGMVKRRGFAVMFKDLRLWSANSFSKLSWHWPAEYIKPLSEALYRVQDEADRKKHGSETLQLVTLRFDGAVEPRSIRGDKEIKGKLYFAASGDVVFSKIDVRNGAIGVVPDGMRCVAVTSEFPVYRVNRDVADSQYIKLLFRTAFFRQTINSMISGASGRKRVQPSQLETLEVPLPPIQIQRAIVERQQRTRDKVHLIEQEIKQQESDLELLFLTCLGIKPSRTKQIPKAFAVLWPNLSRWSVRSASDSALGQDKLPSSSFPYSLLGEIAKVSYGIQKSPANRPGQHARPYLRVANVRKGYLDLSEVKEINVPNDEIESYRLLKGDILFVEGNGSRAELGRVAMWNDEIPNCVHQNHLIKVRCNKSKLIPTFAMFWFNTELGRGHFFRSAKTSSGLGTINSNEVRSAPIPLPPLNTQQGIMAQIAKRQIEINNNRETATQIAHESEAEVEALILGTKRIDEVEDRSELADAPAA